MGFNSGYQNASFSHIENSKYGDNNCDFLSKKKFEFTSVEVF